MKTIIHLPTGDFAYVEQEFDHEMTPEAALEAYNALQGAYRGGDGLNAKEIDAMLDSYFLGTGVDSNQYDKLNVEQSKWLQAIKRSLARVNYKTNKQDDGNDNIS